MFQGLWNHMLQTFIKIDQCQYYRQVRGLDPIHNFYLKVRMGTLKRKRVWPPCMGGKCIRHSPQFHELLKLPHQRPPHYPISALPTTASPILSQQKIWDLTTLPYYGGKKYKIEYLNKASIIEILENQRGLDLSVRNDYGTENPEQSLRFLCSKQI